MTTTDDQLSAISAQLQTFLATLDNSVNWQVLFLAGSTDDPDSFDKDGGKTGALGYYPVVNVSGQTVYMPCLARMKAIALGGANAETLDEVLNAAQAKLTEVAQVTSQAAGAATDANDAAENANQVVIAAQQVVDASPALLAARDQTVGARDITTGARDVALVSAQTAVNAASRFSTVYETLDTTLQKSPLEIHDQKHRVIDSVAMKSDLLKQATLVLFETLVDPSVQPALLVDAKNRIIIDGTPSGGGGSGQDGLYLDSAGLPKVALYNAHTLRRTAMKLRQLKDTVPGTRLRISVFGDSWVESGFKWGRNFARSLWTRYGKTASGFFPANNNAALDTLLSVAAYGSWVGNGDRSAFYPTPDMLVRTSSTAGNTAVVTPDASLPVPSAIKLFFVGTADGVVSWKIGNGAETNVAVQGAGNLIIVSIPAGSLPTTNNWTLTLKVISGTVRFGGGRVEGAGDGVLIDFCGFGGTTSAHWVSVDATQWQAGVTSLDPDLIIILLGTNDKLTGGDPISFAANIKTLESRGRAAKPVTGGTPYADVLVILAANIPSAGAAIGESYAEAVMKVAQANDFAVLDLAKVFGADPASYSGWFSDANHPDPATGGQLINDHVLKAIGA